MEDFKKTTVVIFYYLSFTCYTSYLASSISFNIVKFHFSLRDELQDKYLALFNKYVYNFV